MNLIYIILGKICECVKRVKIGVKTADVNVWRVPVPEDMIVI